jgi:hypothetical protein
VAVGSDGSNGPMVQSVLEDAVLMLDLLGHALSHPEDRGSTAAARDRVRLHPAMTARSPAITFGSGCSSTRRTRSKSYCLTHVTRPRLRGSASADAYQAGLRALDDLSRAPGLGG